MVLQTWGRSREMNKKTYIILSAIAILALSMTFLGSSLDKELIERCSNDDSSIERDCYMHELCLSKKEVICQSMPDATAAQQANKGYCFAFLVSMNHDLGICRDQSNKHYANICEQGYNRWVMNFDSSAISEFNQLKMEYGC
jgi:hypothetical protein